MYNEEQLVINSADGITIPAIYASNKERKAKKVIILLHGISSYKDEYLDFYKTLSEIFIQHDFATLRFDFRGHGESKEPPAEFTIASQIIDLSTVIKYIEKEKQYPSVDLLGCSFGAPPCIFASSLFKKSAIIDKPPKPESVNTKVSLFLLIITPGIPLLNESPPAMSTFEQCTAL